MSGKCKNSDGEINNHLSKLMIVLSEDWNKDRHIFCLRSKLMMRQLLYNCFVCP